MESQPQNPEFGINPKTYNHVTCIPNNHHLISEQKEKSVQNFRKLTA